MLPDLKNTPLTADELLALPTSIAEKETFKAVFSGKVHKEIDPDCESWANRTWNFIPDNTLKIIGYIGEKTGIRLALECSEVLEGK